MAQIGSDAPLENTSPPSAGRGRGEPSPSPSPSALQENPFAQLSAAAPTFQPITTTPEAGRGRGAPDGVSPAQENPFSFPTIITPNVQQAVAGRGRGAPSPQQSPQTPSQPADASQVTPGGRGRGKPSDNPSPPTDMPGLTPLTEEKAKPSRSFGSEMWVCPRCHSLNSTTFQNCATCGLSQDKASSYQSLDDAYVNLPTELADAETRRKGRALAQGSRTGKGAVIEAPPAQAARGRAAPAPKPAAKPAGRGYNMEYAPDPRGLRPVDHEKEINNAEKRMKLAELKKELANKEKLVELKKSGADKELRVDREGDGQAYNLSEYASYYTTTGPDDWLACPSVGEWAVSGGERPGNVPEEKFIQAGLDEARKLVTKFEKMKEEYESRRREEIKQDPLVQEELENMRKKLEEELRAKLIKEQLEYQQKQQQQS